MKTVFTDISTIAHLWANKTQANARNSGNFFFNGDSIYSYGHHFLIAKHVTNKDGESAVLFTTSGYSNTTAKHVRITQQAARHLNLVYCPSPASLPSYNFQAWQNKAESIAANLKTARKPEKYLSQIDSLKDEALKYAAWFGIELPDTLKAVFAITNKEQYIQFSAVKAELKKKAELKQQREQKARHAKELREFRAGERTRLNIHNGFDFLRLSTDGQSVETTQAVKIPVPTAKKFWAYLKKALANGGCTNCQQNILPQWNLRTVTKEKIEIGCHTIQIKECEKIAALLNI